jgi:hypothetical protein
VVSYWSQKILPGVFRGKPNHIPSSTGSCTREVSQACSSAVLNRQEAKKYYEIFIKENVDTMRHPGPWWPRCLGMAFIGPLLLKTLKI